MPAPPLNDIVVHDINIRFEMKSAKYATQAWELEVQLSSTIFGPDYNGSFVVGRCFVHDLGCNMTPLMAFHKAIEQIMKGDKSWRPTLSHEPQ